MCTGINNNKFRDKRKQKLFVLFRQSATAQQLHLSNVKRNIKKSHSLT